MTFGMPYSFVPMSIVTLGIGMGVQKQDVPVASSDEPMQLQVNITQVHSTSSLTCVSLNLVLSGHRYT